MKVNLITPADIRYSYRGTEVNIYEYAKFMIGRGVDARVLVPTYPSNELAEREDYREVYSLYKKVPKKSIRGRRVMLPLGYVLYTYSGLPKDSLVYFPYSIYDHIVNIIRKPKGQKYVIAAHSMHLKDGHIIQNHRVMEGILNGFMRTVFSMREMRENVYHHVITREQARYLMTLGIHKDRIICVPAFVNTSPLKLKPNCSRSLRVVHIGGVNKDAHLILSIIKELRSRGRDKDFEFYFIGEKEPDELLAMAEENSNVHCLGPVKETDKAGILSTMDVVIVPAIETFSRAMLEGLASGLYVVASNLNPAAEEIREMGAHISIPRNGRIEEYVKELDVLLELKHSKAKFDAGKRINREIAVRRFDVNVVLGEILRMFEKIGEKADTARG